MATKLILGIDQGSSGSRAVLLDQAGQVRGYGYRPLARLYPQPGWVEQRPAAVAHSVAAAIDEALGRAGCAPRNVVACGLTSQRDTTFAWDRHSGRALGNAITWQDLRTLPLVEEAERWCYAAERRERLGQFPGASCSAMHMAWRMRHDPAFQKAALAGTLHVSLAAGWVVQALGLPAEHALDGSLLQAMTIFDPRRRALWDTWIDYLGLPRTALPHARPTLHPFGRLRVGDTCVPVTAMLSDQQAALFGYACHQVGQAAATHGIASFINVVVGPNAPPQGICKTCLAWELEQCPTYSLEADMTVTGAAVRWLTQMRLIRRASDLDALAGAVKSSEGVVFVPAFTGLGVPSEDRGARGSIMGMSLGTTSAHIARAFLEAIGCQLREILDTMEREAGIKIEELRVGGGLANSDLACQLQADVAGVRLVRVREPEMSARGAALLAGLGCGFWASPAALPPLLNGSERHFEPRLAPGPRAALLERWACAVERARGWAA
ncbi:FGGY family carbohydrate kinase [Candidatus Viridilinea mediisalina]|uniref:Carbohydrate kinase n=1 Tax=Candidatus Viridilinea mediisalina TaxID=2024553 RepID=A0A2A6RG51_9CHLR|nr:FGGY family carbohydrate kinase [Candidatus Viridilinea mediisalina]PDW01840.1 carbohydrate kinase [Candidatus Viridilinea mediisalina]